MILLDKLIYTSRAWSILSNAYKQNKTSATFLLYGVDGSGRWLHAVAFTALLNCENVQDTGKIIFPCAECRTCRNIFQLNFDGLKIALPIPPHENKIDQAIDFTNEYVEIKRQEPFAILTSAKATNIPISLAREIKKDLSLKSDKAQMRVVLFYQMEKMKKASADALLKMIEEPPANTVIVLISDKVDSLLPTIQSRAQKIKIPIIASPLIKEYIKTKYELSGKKAELYARISEGSIGKALALLESSEESGYVDRAVLFLIFKSLFKESGAETLAHMNDMLNPRDRSEALELLQLWQLLVRDCAHYAISQNDDEIINVDFSAELKNLSVYFQSSQLATSMTEALKNTLADLDRNVHIQGALMALALKMKAGIKQAQK